MDEVLHANIFFFIASGATILFSLLLSVILYQVIKILQTVRTVAERLEAASDQLAHDMSSLRAYVANGGIISRLLSFLVSARQSRPKSRQRRTKKE
jgi:hypothetical protein